MKLTDRGIRITTAVCGFALGFVLVAFVLLLAGCRPADAVPLPGRVDLSVAPASDTTFTLCAIWRPVVWVGDTIRSYRRTITRTDQPQDLSVYGLDVNARISAVDSTCAAVPLPVGSLSGHYRLALRSIAASGTVGRDSAWAVAVWTRQDTFPPPPDSIQLRIDTVGLPLARLDAIPRWDGAGAFVAYVAPIAGAAALRVTTGSSVVTEPALAYPACHPAKAVEVHLWLPDSVTIGCTDGRHLMWTNTTAPNGWFITPGEPTDSLPCGKLWAVSGREVVCAFDVAPYYSVVWVVPPHTAAPLALAVLDSAGRTLGELRAQASVP